MDDNSHIPLAIVMVIFGYLVYQINSISVAPNAVPEQKSSFYKTKTREFRVTAG